MFAQQRRMVLPWILVSAAIIILSAAVILWVHYGTGVNVLVLLVDPVAEVGLPPYVGVFSHIGVLVLWSASTVCLFTWTVLRADSSREAMRRFLLALGALLAWMALDDLFLIHEEVGLVLAESLATVEDRSLFEAPVFALYGLFWMALLLRYRSTIRRTPSILLALAVAALVSSIAIDIGEFVVTDIADSTPWMRTTLSVTEDLAKLGGIVLLMAYAVTTCWMTLRHTELASEP